MLRIGLNVGLSLLFLARLDKSLLSRGYELRDPGFRAYVGFLLLDYHYSNPVVVSFTLLLRDSVAAVAVQPLGSRSKTADEGQRALHFEVDDKGGGGVEGRAWSMASDAVPLVSSNKSDDAAAHES